MARTRNRGISKILLAILLLTVLAISGCGAFGADRGKCTLGKACDYYVGNEGVRMRLDRPPTTLYYSSDIAERTSPDGNTAEFYVELSNEGPSWAYGAVFITGFSPNLFQISKMNDDGRWERIIVPQTTNKCFLDILGMGPSGYGFSIGCSGLGQVVNFGDGTTALNLDVSNVLQFVFDKFDERLPSGLENIDFSYHRQNDGSYSYGVGYDGTWFDFLLYGQGLMLMVQNINFDILGGAEFNMKGDNPDFPGGDIDFKNFKVQMTKQWPAGKDFIQIPYQIKSCYAYSTFVAPSVCIDSNPFSDVRKVCTDYSMSWGGSQGAPVAVTRMEQINTGKEVILEFTIKNVGNGQVWNLEYLSACSPYSQEKVTNRMHDVVYLGPATIDGYRVDCSKFDYVRLDPYTKEGRFTCTYDYDNGAGYMDSGYQTSLKMELWYGYEEIVERQLTVRRLN